MKLTSLSDAALLGARAAVLHALLISLADDYTGTDDVRTKAALAAQIRGTSADLAALSADDSKVGDPVDEIAKRRAARGAGPAAGAAHPRSRSS